MKKKPYLKNYFGQHKKRWVIVREQYWHPAQMEPSFHQLVERKIWSWFAYPVKYLDPILLKDSSVDLRQKFYWEILGQNIWNSKIQHKFMLNFFYRIGLVFCLQLKKSYNHTRPSSPVRPGGFGTALVEITSYWIISYSSIKSRKISPTRQ